MIKFDIEEYGDIDINGFNDFLVKYSDYIGWMDLDKLKDGLPEVKEIAEYIKESSEVLLVVGIGGSYMASKAVSTAISPYFEEGFETYYFGYQLSDEYYNSVIEKVKDKDIVVNVISKSGNTLEIKTFYEKLLGFMKTKYDDQEIKKRIVVTTCTNEGYLYKEAKKQGYKVITHPDDVGGRFTALTPVHTLPLLVNGIDVDKMFEGAYASMESIADQVRYACFRSEMQKNGKLVEAYTVYDEKLNFFIEWLKQLFAESLGKEGKGILPYGVINTRDLHSLEQFFQQGSPIVFETILKVEDKGELSDIENIVIESVKNAHSDIPSVNIDMDKIDEYNLGYLMQFMMVSCAMCGYIEEVNPFDQPGVERYKAEMKQLLG